MNFYKMILLVFLISTFSFTSLSAQFQNDTSFLKKNITLNDRPHDILYKDQGTQSVLPIAIGIVTFLYFFNPIFQYEDDKIWGGLTKEVSVGFGYFGEHRAFGEYSFLFRENQRHFLRFGYNYDILLKKGIQPSNMFQGTGVISVGAGYVTDFDGHGYFPQVSYGYSIRNHKLLFFPHIKARYSLMEKPKANIFDLSFGIIVGIANPFIDLKIRRK
jgi:hypothetical protein